MELWFNQFPSHKRNRHNVCMKRTHLFLPEPIVAALKSLAEKTGLSVSEHIRRAIDEYLKRH